MNANEVLKRRSKQTFAWAIVLSTAAHFLFLAYSPAFRTGDIGFGSSEMTAIDLPPPEIDIPPPPEQIARPATPVVSAATIDEKITIAATTFEANPINALPPPPPSASPKSNDISDAPTFTPMTVAPQLVNEAEVTQLLQKNYPPLLREAGISGVVTVWFYLDTTGRVVRTLIARSSGHGEMDQAALDVADVMRFRPAKNRDRIVDVWVQIPITFQVSRR
jgi:periplasmic protein TonB